MTVSDKIIADRIIADRRITAGRRYEKIRFMILRAFILVSLFFPVYYTQYPDYLKEYYAEFSVAYFLLAVFLLLSIPVKSTQETTRFSWMFLGLVLIYNAVFLYYNVTYLHWYWEQINNTIAFLFFFYLIRKEESWKTEDGDLIRFLIRCIVLSQICAIIYFLLGYTSFSIWNNHIYLYRLPDDYYETRLYWLYSHKSDYAVMLLAFTALFIRYKETFRSWVTFGASLLVLITALYLTNSMTSFAAEMVVLLGGVMDRIPWKKFRFRWYYLLAPTAAGGFGIWWLKKVFATRNLSNFGDRPDIWRGTLQVIREYTHGYGWRFGEVLIPVRASEGRFENNAHNVFLNAVLRFSVPVGICFILIFIFIVGYSLMKSRSFLALGMWGALLLMLNIDYSLLNYEMAMFLFVIYLVCIKAKETQCSQRKRESQ